MKLHSVPTPHLNTVTAYGDGYIEINQHRFESDLLLFVSGDVSRWDAPALEQSNAEAFKASLQPLLAKGLEVLIIGTGARQRLLHPSIVAEVSAGRIGVEVMDTQAACRTYNVLMAEGRKVAAALLIN